MALGDLEEAGQAQLLAWLHSQEPAALVTLGPVDIVKVAHHGSAKQSLGLARYLAPRAAVFSAGTGNPFGHPTARALEIYDDGATALLRTDTCGTVLFHGTQGDLKARCLG